MNSKRSRLKVIFSREDFHSFCGWQALPALPTQKPNLLFECFPNWVSCLNLNTIPEIRPTVTKIWRGERGWYIMPTVSSVQSFNHVRLFATPWAAACQASRSIPTPRAYSNPCPLSWWCHPTISSSVVPFSSCLQSFPASGSFPVSQFFVSGSQSIGVSASASVLPMNIQDWFPLGLTGWISLQSRDSQESSPIPQFKSINL